MFRVRECQKNSSRAQVQLSPFLGSPPHPLILASEFHLPMFCSSTPTGHKILNSLGAMTGHPRFLALTGWGEILSSPSCRICSCCLMAEGCLREPSVVPCPSPL